MPAPETCYLGEDQCPHWDEPEVHGTDAYGRTHWDECSYIGQPFADNVSVQRHPWRLTMPTDRAPQPTTTRRNRTVPPVTPADPVDEQPRAAAPRNCACEACKLARFEPNKIGFSVVHQYSYKPTPWRLKKVTGETPAYYLGVELETDNFRGPTAREYGAVRSRVSNEQAASMRRPVTAWVPKRDASVSGPEFASHPASFKWWKKNRKAIAEMMQMLLHAGYRSHDNDRCGMHINISRSAFKDTKHLFRFLTLLHHNVRWTLKMSQRTQQSSSHWAQLSLTDRAQRLAICESLKENPVPENLPYWRSADTYRYPGTDERYLALNAPIGEPRFEFRLPRGTLRVDRFYKNLEWTVGMIEFSRDNRLDQMTPAKFMAWAIARRDEYPDLVAYIEERFAEQVFIEPQPVGLGNQPDVDENGEAPEPEPNPFLDAQRAVDALEEALRFNRANNVFPTSITSA